MDAGEFRPLGEHWVRIEGDLVFLRVKGVVKLEDMVENQLVLQEFKTAGYAVPENSVVSGQ